MKIRGITIQLNADTSDIERSFKNTVGKSKELQAQLKDVNKLLKFDPKNTELLTQKQKLLNDKIKNSNESLKALQEMQSKLDASGVDKTSKEYMALTREIEDTKLAISNLETEAETTKQELSDLSKPISSMDKFKQKVNEAQSALTKAGEKMKEVGANLSKKVTLPLLAAGTASFKFASDFEDAMGASDQIFKNSAGEVQSWVNNLESYYGIAKSEALTYANTMGSMLQNIGGLTEQEAAKQSETLVKLAGDLTAMFGGSTQDAVNALTGALKGNASMLDNYGMGVNDATIKAKALEMGLIKSTSEMGLQEKQAATLALIMEQTADAQGQASREAEGASGSTRALITELKNLATEIGQVLLPIVTPFISKLKDFVGWFGTLDSGTKTLIVTLGIMAAALGPVISLVGSLSVAAGALNMAMLPFTGIVLGVIAGIAALVAIGVTLYKNWDTIKEKAGQLWQSVKNTFGKIGNFIKDIWSGITNAIKLPKFSIQGKFSILPPSVPSLKVNWHADGGIFNQPTLIPTMAGMMGVGEPRTGGEVVAPLKQLKAMIGDVVRTNSSQSITVVNHFNVDGKRIATEVTPQVNKEMGKISTLSDRDV